MINSILDLTSILELFASGLKEEKNLVIVELPGDNSLLYKQAKTNDDKNLLFNSFCQANLQVEFAFEHYCSFIRNLTEPGLPIAMFTSLRALMETSSNAIYLSDLSIAMTERISRGYSLRYRDLKEQLSLLNIFGSDDDKKVTLERIESVEKDAINYGFKKVINRQNERIGIAKTMPSIINIIKETSNNELLYRYFSGVLHGNFWAVKDSIFRKVKTISNDQNRSYTEMEKGFEFKTVIDMSKLAILLLFTPENNIYRLAGWNVERLLNLYNLTLLNFKTE